MTESINVESERALRLAEKIWEEIKPYLTLELEKVLAVELGESGGDVSFESYLHVQVADVSPRIEFEWGGKMELASLPDLRVALLKS